MVSFHPKMRFFVQALCLFLFTRLPLEGLRAEASGFEALRDETFEAVWQRVSDSYYDASFGGLDWDEVGARYRARLPQTSSMADLRGLLSEMLYELGDSHLALLSSDYDPEAIFTPWSGGWAGVDACFSGKDIVLYRLDPTGPAYAAGIRDGDRLLRVDGRSIEDFRRQLRESGLPKHVVESSTLLSVLSRLKAGAGDQVELLVKPPKARKRPVRVTLARYEGRTTEPLGQLGRMPFSLEYEIREEGAGYVRFSLWFPAAMPDLRRFVGDLPADAPGLVIDLRGNPGGLMAMAGGLSGMILDTQSELGRTTLREGHINVVGFPQRKAFLGRVAVLVDEASVSTSEVFAFGLQELGRVRVFGQPTPGAALPSMFTALPNGDSLQMALGDFKTPNGVSLEGRGVVPDEIVSVSPVDLSKGRDTVLLAALKWIHQTD